ncbi:MAG: sigma-E processing peptidase SpoIIGA [Clostridia bacterium]|nr:sigma-E processing peptidase SpoIIGA [Clostridia bacterium]
MVLYVDVLFLLNAIIDYALLRITAKVMGHPRRRGRLLIAAILGALYAVTVCLPVISFVGHWFVRFGVGVTMGLVAFGCNRACVRKTLVFGLLAATFGGVVYALSLMRGSAVRVWNGAFYADVSLPFLLATIGGVYALLTLFGSLGVKRVRAERRILTVHVSLCGRSCTFSALADTGCLLTDPLTTRPVMVTALDAVAPILPQEVVADLQTGFDVVDLIAAHNDKPPFLRPIFYRGVTGGESVLVAFQPTTLTVDGESVEAVLAISRDGFCGENGFSAVISADAV